MPIKEKLSRIGSGLCFLFCLLLSPQGWSSAPAPEERGDGFSLRRRAPLEEEIIVLPKDAFENLRVRPGGTTLSSSLFREKRTGQEWIGKSQGISRGDPLKVAQEENESLACREKIASDIYGLYGVSVPRTVLSRQHMTNTGIECLDEQEVIHILSCKIDDYHDYKKQFRFPGFLESLDPEFGPVVCHDSRCLMEACRGEKKGRFLAYDVEGLGRAAAVATWIHDIDFIGASATNIGYRIVQRAGQSFAELIMVDPGESFSDPSVHPYPPTRHIRFAMPGSEETHTIAFERLFPEGSRARNEFLMTLHAIINTDERTIVRFFARPGAEFFISRDPRSIPGLTRQLMERQKQLFAHYAPELEASRERYEAEEIEMTRTIINAIPSTRTLGAPGIPPAREVTGGSSSVVVAPIGVAIPRTSFPALPDIARGHEEIYRRFMSGRLIYKPDPSSDVGKIEIPFASIVNPETLEGTFDLSRCGDAGKYLSISTGYRKGKKAENSSKVETWIVPKFIVERDIGTSARHMAPIMGSYTSPLGLFWTWGGWDDLSWYDYLVGRNFDEVSSEDLYENWKKALGWREQPSHERRTFDAGVSLFVGRRGMARGHLSSILIKM